MDRPYKLLDDNIISAKRLNQLSKAKMIEEYLKLGEVLKTSRMYSGSLHMRIGSYRRLMKVRRYKRKAVYNRRKFKVEHMRQVMRDKTKKEIKHHKEVLSRKMTIKIREQVNKKVAVRVKRARKVIPRRVARARKLMTIRNNKKLRVSRRKIYIRIKGIQKRHYRHRLKRVSVTVRNNHFIGLIKRQRLPQISRTAGIYGLLILKVSKTLNMRLDDLSYLLWFGTYESFNVGTVEVSYPGIGSISIRKKVNRFVRMGYLHGIGTFKGRKNYALTHVGKEFYERVVRYMKKFKRPGQGKKLTKKRFHLSFRKKKTIAGS